MTHPHFVLGLFLGLTLSVACILHGTDRLSSDLATQQVPVCEKCQNYATGEFTGP